MTLDDDREVEVTGAGVELGYSRYTGRSDTVSCGVAPRRPVAQVLKADWGRSPREANRWQPARVFLEWHSVHAMRGSAVVGEQRGLGVTRLSQLVRYTGECVRTHMNETPW